MLLLLLPPLLRPLVVDSRKWFEVYTVRRDICQLVCDDLLGSDGLLYVVNTFSRTQGNTGVYRMYTSIENTLKTMY